MNPFQLAVKLVGITLSLSVLCILSGCRENAMVKNDETDNNLLRLPGQSDPTLPKANTPLLPLTKGSHWDFTVERVSSNGQRLAAVPGRLLAAGPTKIDSQDGYILQTIVDGHVTKEDVFAVRNDGLYLLATGNPNALSTLSPAILAVGLPVTEGVSHNWSGLLHYRTSSGFGNALSRVSGHKKMGAENGGTEAYRCDLLIITTVNGKRESIPMTRWIAPGIGIVNQRELSGSTTEIWDLKSHEILPN